MSASRRSGLAIDSDPAELDWLRERGVRIDHKGRIIVRLPEPDIELDLRDDDEPSITELMRRDVVRRGSVSRGRRRVPRDNAQAGTTIVRRRRGRPVIGEEVRVRVQTTIDPCTRELLKKWQRSLAEVLDGCARELVNGE